jgi:hypothetical protein
VGDPIPSTDKELVDKLQNFGVRLAAVVATFNLVAADATAVSTDGTNLRTLVLDQEDKVNAARSATAAKNTARLAIVKRTRALIRRLKSHPNYTPALGEQLGIVAGSSSGSGVTPMSIAVEVLRPDLRGSIGAHGEVNVGFAKRGHTGILLYGRRTGEEEWTLLSKQLRSPYVDNRPNLAAGAPETREYRAAYVDVDAAVGQLSDTLTVTVPGIGFADGGKPAPTTTDATAQKAAA